MDFSLILNLSGDMALLALVAYLLGRSPHIAKYVNQPLNLRSWLIMTFIFSTLSILGTYNGIPIEGAFANTRLIGTLMSGIMGGPLVGLSAGSLSGLHRYFVGGFTAETCAAATALGGLFAGLVRQKIGLNNMDWKTAGAIALVAEVVQKSMVLAFAKPFEAALALESIIAIPTTIVSVLGTVVFMFIIKDIQSQQEIHGARAAELSLRITNQTLPYLRHGLTAESGARTAEIIYALTKVDAVAITNREKVLAFVGKGDDHHHAGEPVITQSTKRTLDDGTLCVLRTRDDRGCPVPDCPLVSGVVAPLTVNGLVVGTLKLSRTGENSMSEMDIELARGIAQLLSVQIALAEIDEQRKMREKAELKALRAQINPHFLFNTLSIIMSFCRTNPEAARSLLGNLASLLQYSFDNQRDFITLAEELEKIDAYMEIAKSRFGAKLTVSHNISPDILTSRIPVFTLQPLVENAVQHGLFPKLADCHLHIEAKQTAHDVIITVSDNGVGIDPSRLKSLFLDDTEGIGLKNVYSRLRGIYGEPYGLTLDSVPGRGTAVTIRIPYSTEVESNAC